jgi:hypothetical protein
LITRNDSPGGAGVGVAVGVGEGVMVAAGDGSAFSVGAGVAKGAGVVVAAAKISSDWVEGTWRPRLMRRAIRPARASPWFTGARFREVAMFHPPAS